MRRREFIALAGGAAVALPRAADAQQPAMPVIGFLNITSPDTNTERLRAFREGLKEHGYIEGDNVLIEYRWAQGRSERLPELAADLVRRKVTLIAAPGATPLILATKAATTTIPAVFAVGEDPVRLGLVASLAKPGGNLTGINFFNAELLGKRLALLLEMVPNANRIALLVNPSDPRNTEITVREVELAGRALRRQIQVIRASTSGEIDARFAALAGDRPDALMVMGNAYFNSRRMQLALLAMRHGIPASYGSRDYPEHGGLMSYGTNVTDAFRQAGVYAGRILKGASPADLPVMQSTKFELVINNQCARIMGLTVPASLLARADEVIE